jgi:hypothetical protein
MRIAGLLEAVAWEKVMVALPNGCDENHGVLSELANFLGVDVGLFDQLNHLQNNHLHTDNQDGLLGQSYLEQPYLEQHPGALTHGASTHGDLHLNMHTHALQHFNDDPKTMHSRGYGSDEHSGQALSSMGLAQTFDVHEQAMRTHQSHHDWHQDLGHGAHMMQSAHSFLMNRPSFTVSQSGSHVHRHDQDGSEHDVGTYHRGVYANNDREDLVYQRDGVFYDYSTDKKIGSWVGGIMFDRNGVEIGRADTAVEAGAYIAFGIRGGVK